MDDTLSTITDRTSRQTAGCDLEASSKSSNEAWSAILSSSTQSTAEFKNTEKREALPELMISSIEPYLVKDHLVSSSVEDQQLAKSIADVMNSDVSLDERKQQLVDWVETLKLDPERMQRVLSEVETYLESGVHFSFEFDFCFDEYGLVLFDENVVGDKGIYIASFSYPEGVEHPAQTQPTDEVCIAF